MRGNQSSTLAVGRLDLCARLLEPIRDQVRATRHAVGVALAQGFGVVVAQLAAHLGAPQKRRVADDGIHAGPLCFAAISIQHGIAVFDVAERLQDEVVADGVTVFQHPLDFTDPHGDARKLGGIGVEFNAQHVGGRSFNADLSV